MTVYGRDTTEAKRRWAALVGVALGDAWEAVRDAWEDEQQSLGGHQADLDGMGNWGDDE